MHFLANDLRGLSSLVDGSMLDDWRAYSVINSLATMLKQQIKAVISIEKMHLYKMTERARVLVSSRDVV